MLLVRVLVNLTMPNTPIMTYLIWSSQWFRIGIIVSYWLHQEPKDLPCSPASQSEETYITVSPKEVDSQSSMTIRSSTSEASHRSMPGSRMPTWSQSMVEATYLRLLVELAAMPNDAVSQLYIPAIRQQRWSKIQALLDSFDDR